MRAMEPAVCRGGSGKRSDASVPPWLHLASSGSRHALWGRLPCRRPGLTQLQRHPRDDRVSIGTLVGLGDRRADARAESGGRRGGVRISLGAKLPGPSVADRSLKRPRGRQDRRRRDQRRLRHGVKGTETLITPATCPFTNRSFYGPRTAAGARAYPGLPSTPGS